MSDLVFATRPKETVPDLTNIKPLEIEVLAQEAFFMEDCVKVVLTGGVEKLVSYDTFFGIIKNLSNVMDNQAIDGFNLPSNTFFFAKSGDRIQLSCYYSSRITSMKYWDSKFNIVTPNIIISHTLAKDGKDGCWKMTGSRYFCTDLSVGNLPKTFIYGISHKEHIFLLPMTNTYSEGNMCYGSNSMPQKFTDNNLRGLDWYFQYLWETPFNDDLGLYAVNTSSNPRAWYHSLRDLASSNQPFPYEKLRGFTPR